MGTTATHRQPHRPHSHTPAHQYHGIASPSRVHPTRRRPAMTLLDLIPALLLLAGILLARWEILA